MMNEFFEFTCSLPWQKMVIDCSGIVAPCCFWAGYGKTNPPVGDVNRESIEEIWNGPAYQNLRQQMAKGDLTAAGCEGCYALRQGIKHNLVYDSDMDAEISPFTAYARNIQVLKEEIEAGKVCLRAKPTIVSFTYSHKCNIRCLHCYQTATRDVNLNHEVAREVLGLVPILVQLIAGGGEPLIDPFWREFLGSYRSETNPYLDFATTTNATVLLPDVEQGLKALKRLSIIVSLDGTGDVFEGIRKGAKFDTVCKNIRKLNEIVYASPSSLSMVGVSMSVMKSNIRDMANVIRFASQEKLYLGLSPVSGFPVDESLTCFNDAGQETEGWFDAYTEAWQVAEHEYVPMIVDKQESKECLDAPVQANHTDEHGFVPATGSTMNSRDNNLASLREFWRHIIDLIKQQTPWSKMSEKHVPVTVVLPEDMVGAYKKDLADNEHLLVYLYKDSPDGLASARYYAYVHEYCFHASVTPGRYFIGLSSRWIVALPQGDIILDVDDEGRVKLSGSAIVAI